ncbi:MAG: WD40 repeat domain-containing protein [Anaerolineae bacterium]|nr:WD40 repeat domain-containing protein [Anaerolineae bacterium]
MRKQLCRWLLILLLSTIATSGFRVGAQAVGTTAIATPQTQTIIATTWSPDGSKIARSGTGGFLSIWDANTGNLIRNFIGLSGTIYTVAWSPDSTKIASAGDDKLIHIWNVSNGQSLANLIGHNDSILSLDWSPDGSKIASVSAVEHLSLRIWDTATFQQLNAFQAGNLQSVKWSLDGSKIAVVNTNAGIVIVDPLATIPIQNWVDYLVGPNSSVSGSAGSMAWRNDNTTIAVGYFDGKIYLWNVATNQQVSVLQGHTGWVGSLSWSPDGTQLASASNDGTIKLWNVATGEQIASFTKPQSLTTSIAWNPDGSQLAYGDGTDLKIVTVADLLTPPTADPQR